MTFACNRCNTIYEVDFHPGRCAACGCPEFTLIDTDRKDSSMRVSATETETNNTTAAAAPEDESALDQLLEETATTEGMAPWETERAECEDDKAVGVAAAAVPMDGSDSAPLMVDGSKIPDAAAEPEAEPASQVEDQKDQPADQPADQPGEQAAEPALLAPKAEETAEQLRTRVIRELETDVANAAIRRAHAKAEAKTANKRFDDATEELADYLDRPAEKLPLFDGREKNQTLSDSTPVTVTFGNRSVKTTIGEVIPLLDSASEAAAEDSLAAAAADQDEEFGDWRKVPLSSLGLSAGILKALAEESGITDVGHVADWTSAGSSVVDLPKIGKAKAAKIDEAMDEFWRSRKA